MPRLLLECSPTPAVYDRRTGNRYPISSELHDLLDDIERTQENNDFTEELSEPCLFD